MFSGIVKGLCRVASVTEKIGGRQLAVALHEFSQDLETGASVAINGACLTVVALQDGVARFDVIEETLIRTDIGILKSGDFVNIERSCRIGDEIGGHHVMGHVDTRGTIGKIRNAPNNREIAIHHDPQWHKYMIPKGWIAVDGISLTVVAVARDHFSVCLIPETLARTTLGFKETQHSVNLEFDHATKVIVTTIERMGLPALSSS